MGWNWAVFLAQSFLMEQITRIAVMGPERQLVEGEPTPVLDDQRPFVFFGHIDDFGVGGLVNDESGCEATR